MSQLEFAEKLNYTDKAVSKWERGDSLPDIVILKQIADLFGITVNELLSNNEAKKPLIKKNGLLSKHALIALLSVVLVWLVATILFVFMQLFNVLNHRTWLFFIYAIPVSAIVCIVFSAIWKKKFCLFSSETVLNWTLALSLYLSITFNKMWLIFMLAIPVQIMFILWNILKRKR